MKHICIILTAMLMFGCGMKVRIQGIEIDWVKNREWTKVAAGALSSVAAHELAHYAVAEAKGLNPEFTSLTTFRYTRENDWVERAGFLTQTGIGLILNLIPATRNSDFTLGWNGVSAAQLYSYDLRHGDTGDFDTTGHNEWSLFTGVATINTLWTMNNQKLER
jgi:hypothetical protein